MAMTTGFILVLICLAIGTPAVIKLLYRSYIQPTTVNHSQVVMSRSYDAPIADRQTDRADRPSVSADNLEVPRLQLDRTKATLIEVMVYNGWQVGEIRSMLKGDNGAIGAEIEAARKRLGILPTDRILRVKDIHGERVIPF